MFEFMVRVVLSWLANLCPTGVQSSPVTSISFSSQYDDAPCIQEKSA
jgi:hypothetical protein